MKASKFSQNFMAYYFAFIQFQCILLNFAFVCGAFESRLQNFDLIWTGSKFSTWQWRKFKKLILQLLTCQGQTL
jgi:hypothetical protein